MPSKAKYAESTVMLGSTAVCMEAPRGPASATMRHVSSGLTDDGLVNKRAGTKMFVPPPC